MPHIHFIPDEQVVDVKPDCSILETSLAAGIAHAHACGGHARCSTCRVLLLKGLENCQPRNSLEEVLAHRLNFPHEIRLACQTLITGDIEVRRLVLDEEDIRLTSRLGREEAAISVGEEKRVAILFSDIRGFTSFAEALLPFDVIHVLNRYFLEMEEAIAAHGGSIQNYMGDGLMALFGLDDAPDASLRAVRAGLQMLETLQKLNPYLEAVYHHQFRIGIGVHFGEVVVGTIGSTRSAVTAIGDAVNLASRIEAANKATGTRFLISEETYQHVKDQVPIGRHYPLELPGKSGVYTLYEVTGMS